ncbi:MAG: rod shape-determining protein MreD [Polyangiaceae bacterium]|nr:rod shape-determining protein MreD [Polyangiaceae bacterium]
MRNVAYLTLGFLLLLVQGTLYRLMGPLSAPLDADGLRRALGFLSATPNLVLPVIIFLGVQEASVARGVVLAFALGHLTDLMGAAPMYLFTFVSVAMWGLAKLAGVRFSAQTPLTRVPLVFGFSLVEGAVILTLLAIFGTDNRRPIELLALVLPRAVVTALFAPIVFRLCQRVAAGTAVVRSAEAGGGT